MSFRAINILLLILILFIALFSHRNSSRASQGSADYKKNMQVFNKSLALIEAKYVHERDADVLVQSAVEEMLYQLDPYTQFLDLRQHNELMMDTEGKYGGIGLSVDIRDDVLTAISPIEGTPAFKAGIQAGDRIIGIDGEATEGLSIDECVDRMRGDPGTSLVLTIEREGFDDSIEFRLTRDIIEIKSVPYFAMLDDFVGYVKLAQFSQGTSNELKEALKKLEDRGLKSLILDLRGNPGGLLNQAVRVVETFIDAGKEVVSTNGRLRDARHNWSSKHRATHPDFPLIVLINEGSASASEIVAGAIQDWDRGIIMGKSSFGKGSVQTVYELDGGDAIKITTARYYTPSGRCIHKDDNEFTRDYFPEAGQAMKTHDFTELGTGEYFTKINKRLVKGGGGIVPDLEVNSDTLSQTMRRIEMRVLPFKFAVRYTATHDIVNPDFIITDEMLNEFYQLTKEENIEISEIKRKANRDEIAYALRREILAKLWGSEARYQEILKHDSQIAEAIELLHNQNKYVKWLSGGVPK